jgi:hypothetical protein
VIIDADISSVLAIQEFVGDISVSTTTKIAFKGDWGPLTLDWGR